MYGTGTFACHFTTQPVQKKVVIQNDVTKGSPLPCAQNKGLGGRFLTWHAWTGFLTCIHCKSTSGVLVLGVEAGQMLFIWPVSSNSWWFWRQVVHNCKRLNSICWLCTVVTTIKAFRLHPWYILFTKLLQVWNICILSFLDCQVKVTHTVILLEWAQPADYIVYIFLPHKMTLRCTWSWTIKTWSPFQRGLLQLDSVSHPGIDRLSDTQLSRLLGLSLSQRLRVMRTLDLGPYSVVNHLVGSALGWRSKCGDWHTLVPSLLFLDCVAVHCTTFVADRSVGLLLWTQPFISSNFLADNLLWFA